MRLSWNEIRAAWHQSGRNPGYEDFNLPEPLVSTVTGKGGQSKIRKSYSVVCGSGEADHRQGETNVQSCPCDIESVDEESGQ